MAAARESAPGIMRLLTNPNSGLAGACQRRTGDGSLLNHPPERDMDILARRLKLNAHLCADLDRFGFGRVDAAQHRGHSIPFVQVDVRRHKRRLGRPATERPMLHREGMDAALAAALN